MASSKRIKIYTKLGDQGNTSLFNGVKVLKSDLRVCAYGTVDELNSYLGWIVVEIDRLLSDLTLHKELSSSPSAKSLMAIRDVVLQLQNEMFQLGSDLATPIQSGKQLKISRIDETNIRRIEQWIDQFDQELPILKNFILPGGCELSARFHIARAVSRRAEREIVRAVKEQPSGTQQFNEFVVPYINRLSDLLFVLARYSNFCLKINDRVWQKDDHLGSL